MPAESTESTREHGPMIAWIVKYRERTGCSIADAKAAFEASPDYASVMHAQRRRWVLESAAPNLLAALEKLANSASAFSGLDHRVAEARAAIAKAKR